MSISENPFGLDERNPMIYKVVLELDDGTTKTFRTDEWNEEVVLKRIKKMGKKILKNSRISVKGTI